MNATDEKIIGQFVGDFVKRMKRELLNNEHKGDWKQFLEVDDIESEIFYHISKLKIAIEKEDKVKAREFIADSANLLLFLGHAHGLYENSKVVERLTHHELFKLKFFVGKIHGIKPNCINEYTRVKSFRFDVNTNQVRYSEFMQSVQSYFKLRIPIEFQDNFKTLLDVKNYIEENR